MPSTVIKDFRYDAAHARLTITFINGRIYEYYAVPPATDEAMRRAFSKGTFFNRQIREHFPFKDATPPGPQLKRVAR